MKKFYLKRFRESLKQTRLKNGYTQKQLAEKLHVSPQTISDYERGKVDPTVEYIIHFCMVMKVGPFEMKGEKMMHTVLTEEEYELIVLLRKSPAWTTYLIREMCIFARNHEKNLKN